MEARRTSSLPEARREHSLGRTFSATISAWMSAGVGKQRRSGGFTALQAVIQALTQTVDCCLSDQIRGDLSISVGWGNARCSFIKINLNLFCLLLLRD